MRPSPRSTCKTARSRSPGRASSRRPALARAVSSRPSSPATTRASTSTTKRTGPAPAPWWTPGRRRCPESTASNLRILPRDESRADRDALLRRGLASLDLPQGHHRRRRRRLGRDHGFARLAARAGRHRRGSRPAGRRARPTRRRADRLGSLPRHAPEPGIRDPEGDRRDRERPARPQREGARRSRVRALRRADARRRRCLLVALRHHARAWEVTNTDKLASYDDVVKLGAEVVERGFPAFKTNIVIPGDEPQVLMPGFQGEGLDRNPSPELEDALVQLLDAFAEGTQGEAEPIVDLNFNLTAEGVLRIARTLEDHDLMWLEVDAFDPVSLAAVRNGSAIPICSGENLYTNRGFRPFFETGAMDVASVDVIWNGFHQAKKIADLAETFKVNCAPHNYYSHLATFISAQWCAAIPNVRILEVDVDDVPWREELTTVVPQIADGKLTIPTTPGWGADVDEDVLREHPWPE